MSFILITYDRRDGGIDRDSLRFNLSVEMGSIKGAESKEVKIIAEVEM